MILAPRNFVFFTVVALLFGFSSVASAESTIRLETYAGAKHSMNSEGWPQWVTQVEDAGKGSIKIKMTFPPINPRDLLDRVRTGIADMAWITHGYTTGRFVFTDIVELPGLDGNAEQMSRAYWRIHEKHLAKFNEHKGVKLLALFSHGPGMMHTRQAVTQVSQLKGLKIRTGGGVQSAIAKRLGIVSVSAPATKAHELLSQGVADGIFFSLETITAFKLGDVVKYHYSMPGGLYAASFAVIMNEDKFNSMAKSEQDALMSVAGEEMSAHFGRVWDRSDKFSHNALSKSGNTISPVSAAVHGALKERLADLDGEWIKKAKSEGLANAAQVLAELREEVQKVKKGM
jgi:TRAP-type C4-dicarboxylate transport system substrate-binding protein